MHPLTTSFGRMNIVSFSRMYTADYNAEITTKSINVEMLHNLLSKYDEYVNGDKSLRLFYHKHSQLHKWGAI